MNFDYPILAVDDDEDDLLLLKEAHKELNLPHPLITFNSGDKLVDYLQSSKQRPLLIICDYNLPKANGMEIRKNMLADSNTHYRSIPFVLLSTAMNEAQIRRGFDYQIQGFFVKPRSFAKLKEILSALITYWQLSEIPSSDLTNEHALRRK